MFESRLREQLKSKRAVVHYEYASHFISEILSEV